ncbi:GNAT family N-acetyltransferase [Clostridium chromiireducens]|uniref:GNAT family N-acetyltransferase n=1 Tax=Clostridium chromiireducens TaxID=225345 RepID=A0A964RTC6_9CLOT|nr:GNAT family N-acetyltransferase [Clostridium chromiireducens]MVX67457.1 GNAT family N-acetyltransferase [Clostridium chromiireducens]
MINQADENDILTIEGILLDAVIWMKKNKLQNQWNEDSIKWNYLSKYYQVSDFYINYQNGVPAACIAITDLDLKYWSEIPQGKSLYIHKLAVKREFAGKGISKELIDFAKKLSLKNSINSLRLDCNLQRNELRMLYENEGFIYAGRKNSESNYEMALYVWHI